MTSFPPLPWNAITDDDDIASDLAVLAGDIEAFLKLKERYQRSPEPETHADLLHHQHQIANRIEFLSVMFGAYQKVFAEYDSHLRRQGLRQVLLPVLPETLKP
jgi:hypothetical protein